MIEILAELVGFDSSKRFAEPARMILKECWFSDLEILGIWEEIVTNTCTSSLLESKHQIPKSKNPFISLKYKILKTETPQTPGLKVNNENHDWKEDYITISQESKLEKKSKYKPK